MRTPTLIVLALCAACQEPSEPWPDDRVASLAGAIETSQPRGDAWLFLYPSGHGPPGAPEQPLYLTAVSDVLRQQRESRYVFARVAPNPLRLWGFIDTDRNFEPTIDVLAQPGAGDRIGVGVEVNLQPGKQLEQPVTLDTLVPHEPPAFRIDIDSDDLPLDASPTMPATFTLVSDPMNGRLDPKQVGFHVGLVDVDDDGRPDDANGDGIPDLTLQVFLRFKPRPGQAATEGEVIVPLLFNPAPLLNLIGGRLDTEATVQSLQLTVVPAAQRVKQVPGELPQIEMLGAPPVGEYEVVALTQSGQFWRLPNALAAEVPSQTVRLHFDRSPR